MEIKRQWKRNSSIIVDLSAIRSNVNTIKSQLDPDTKIMPVVKADAYGHGSAEVATAISGEADWFAVNDVEEGIILRNAGIEQPILVFGVPDSKTADYYSRYSLTATVSDLAHFELLMAGTEYHLNFNTGMGRLGLQLDEIEEVIDCKNCHSRLICTGLYSHFATSDNPNSPKVLEQLDLFKEIRSAFPGEILTHISNTGATFFYEGMDFDIVRTGIGIYGYAPGEAAIEALKPALDWESSLIQVNPVKKGETVSYGAIWEAPRDGFVGIIPVGYEDGLRRSLSGQIDFNIKGKSYPQVGTITMNYCMVFLGQERFPAGTKVHLISAAERTLASWSQNLGTIPYELLTSLSGEIPRTYKG